MPAGYSFCKQRILALQRLTYSSPYVPYPLNNPFTFIVLLQQVFHLISFESHTMLLN